MFVLFRRHMQNRTPKHLCKVCATLSLTQPQADNEKFVQGRPAAYLRRGGRRFYSPHTQVA